MISEVTEVRVGPVALVAMVTWVVDTNNKVISAKIKQLSLIEEQHVDKPGRLSTVSTTSAKSSTSSGSVGLPGPFPLPGKTSHSRLSAVSSVSSATSSSSASNQAWDGPFLKPQVPGSKLNVPFSCENCGHHFPPVDRSNSSSPVENGSPPIEGEAVESNVKPLKQKRKRKLQGSHTSSTVSSGPSEEETSSSGSQPPPQASSTPAKLPRGRRLKKQMNGTVHRSTKKERSTTPVRTLRSVVVRPTKNGTPQSTKKVEKGEDEAVFARWGGDGRYYPGWVSNPLTGNQVLVRFCDGQSKTTALTKMVRADIITPGTLVLAATPTGKYLETLVVQVDLSGVEPVYMVESDKTQQEVRFPSIALQQSTVTELTVSEAQKYAVESNFLSNDLTLGEDEAVFARWGGDGRYYPGWVSNPLTGNQVLVRFCDGQSKTTALTKMVRADIITPGTLVLAATPTGKYLETLVVQVDLSGVEPVYMVESDKTQQEVRFPSIALQQSTVTELTVSEAQKYAVESNFLSNDLTLENITAHPRKRSARTPVEGSRGRKRKRQTTPQPCTSHGQTYNGPEYDYEDSDSSIQSTCSLTLRGMEIEPLDVECFPPESIWTKLVYNRGNMAYKKKKGKLSTKYEALVVKEAGPIPEPGSELFTNYVFLITYTDNVKLLSKEHTYSRIEDSNRSLLNYTLWRDRLRIQIHNGGGKVYNSFSEVTKEELPNTYLITDKQCNTPLYLQCLVNDIPIYSHSVVIQCCVQNRPWKEVISSRGIKRMLAGYSLSRRCLVNPRRLTPLQGRTILLALSGDPALSTFWHSLITKVGGSVDLYPHGLLEENKYDVVVTDADCDREFVWEACVLGVPLVSVTWLQQVIVTGEWRPPTEHPLYNYCISGEWEGISPEY